MPHEEADVQIDGNKRNDQVSGFLKAHLTFTLIVTSICDQFPL